MTCSLLKPPACHSKSINTSRIKKNTHSHYKQKSKEQQNVNPDIGDSIKIYNLINGKYKYLRTRRTDTGSGSVKQIF